MHHKRRRPKKSRAGCLMCKPWKANGVNEEKASVKRHIQDRYEDPRDRIR